MYSIFNDRAKGMKAGLMKEKDLKDAQISDLTDFYDRSFFFPYMADFKSKLPNYFVN